MSALRWAGVGALGVLAAMFVVTLQRPDVVSRQARREKRREAWAWKPGRWRQPRIDALYDLAKAAGVGE